MSDAERGQFERLQRRIREVAYLMWETAGAQHGRALEFWLAAEREVLRSIAVEFEALDAEQPGSNDTVDAASQPSSEHSAEE